MKTTEEEKERKEVQNEEKQPQESVGLNDEQLEEVSGGVAHSVQHIQDSMSFR